MADYATIISLAGYVLGTLGGVLVFVEFFQTPNYITYDAEWNNWSIDVSPPQVQQHTWAGRIGALFIALAFALQFVATLLAM